MSIELPGPLVSPAWLAEHLDDVVVLDASDASCKQTDETIGGGLRFDIDGPFSDHDSDLPHTMIGVDDFRREARKLGLNDDSVVVVYDTRGIYSAPRAWWMLRAMGLDTVAVLDGGLRAWQAAGHPTTPRAELPAEPGNFEPRPRDGAFVDAETVLKQLEDPTIAVADARSRGRFAGSDPEPRPGLRGGHMPGAVNIPFTELLDGGAFLTPGELRTHFEEAAGDRTRFTMTCGSGLTACILALGATLAGHEDISIYDGSWSEWGRPGPLPVV